MKSKINLPSKEEYFKLLDEFKVPGNVRKHNYQVNQGSMALAKELIKVGEEIDLELLDMASLFHDFLRVVDMKELDTEEYGYTASEEEIEFWKQLREEYQGMHHGDATAKFLQEKYPELAKTVRRHKYHCLSTDDAPQTWEEKILNYVDKRVKHDELVSLKERFDDIEKRYPELKTNPESIKNKGLIIELEKEIFDKLSIKPEDLKRITDEEK